MIDQGKFKRGAGLIKDSGVRNVVLMANDGTYQSCYVEGSGLDLVNAFYDTMKKDEEFALIVGMAWMIYAEEKEEKKEEGGNG